MSEGGGGPAPAPDPVPVTTIAWRVGHLSGTVAGFASRRFGNRDLTEDTLDFPAAAAAVDAFLAEHCGTWRRGLAGLDASGWSGPLGPGWGPYADADTVDLALHVLDEVIHYGAEVGVLRDLWSAGARPVSQATG